MEGGLKELLIKAPKRPCIDLKEGKMEGGLNKSSKRPCISKQENG